MSEPRTEAGGALNARLDHAGYVNHLEEILAIEAEARAGALREAAERVRGLVHEQQMTNGDMDSAAVLAVLEAESVP